MSGLRGRLVAAMADMGNPVRSSVATVPTKGGGKYTYRYETLDQVLAIVRPALAAHGIGLTQSQEYLEGAGWVLETVVFDDEESLTVDRRPMREFAGAQEAGSWETYMRRYSLKAAFGLAGEDDDGAAASGRADLAEAKAVLWGAVRRYADAEGSDPSEIAEDVKARPDYREDPARLRAIASELDRAACGLDAS